MGDDHGGGGGGDARHVVMLGQPEAVIAQPLRMPGQIEAVLQRLPCGRALHNRGQIENGELCHGRDIGDAGGSARMAATQAAGGDSVTDAKGMAVAEIAREFFGVQLHYAGVLSAKAGMPLAEAITFHTNFHRLFAYGNLGKMKPDPEFVALVRDVVALAPEMRLDHLIAAYARTRRRSVAAGAVSVRQSLRMRGAE
jgi:hypothetical protein